MTRFFLWLSFSRPKTLVAGVAPVMLAATLVWQRNLSLNVLSFFLVLALAVAVQVACNFTNDYYDHLRNADRETTRKGPLRALQRGEISSADVLRAIVVLNIVIFAMAIYFAINFGWIFAVVVMVSQIAGYSYTGGKFPLAYNGLGDLFAFVFFGPVVVLSSAAILNNGEWLFTMPFLAVSVVCALFSLALIAVNNFRDAEGDAVVGKKTLAVLFGKNFVAWEYRTCILLLAFFPISAAWQHGRIFIALPVFTLLLVFPAVINMQRLSATKLNELLAKTGAAYFVYAFLWCIALLVY